MLIISEKIKETDIASVESLSDAIKAVDDAIESNLAMTSLTKYFQKIPTSKKFFGKAIKGSHPVQDYLNELKSNLELQRDYVAKLYSGPSKT